MKREMKLKHNPELWQPGLTGPLAELQRAVARITADMHVPERVLVCGWLRCSYCVWRRWPCPDFLEASAVIERKNNE